MREKDLRNLVKGLTKKVEEREKQIYKARCILEFALEMGCFDDNNLQIGHDTVKDFLATIENIKVTNKKKIEEDESDTEKTWGC